ncbi:hypothetical protein NUM3379_39890 [Kineococcus sp. NUM-3379]
MHTTAMAEDSVAGVVVAGAGRSARRRGGGIGARPVAWLSVTALALVAFCCAGSRERAARGGDRGDVPGWVLVTLMTAGLVVGLWAVAGPRLEAMFTESMDRVLAGS